MPTSNWRSALAAAKRLALRFPGVTAVDYGYKYVAAKRSALPCVRFHVSHKKAADALRPHEMLPSELGSVACDVLQARYVPHALTPPHAGQAQAGMGIGNAARQSSGTLGAIVRDAGSGRLCLLSSWHALCASAAAKRGESISRPGRGTLPAQDIASLERWLDPQQGCDAAIAILSAEVSHDDLIADLGVRIDGLEEPRLGLALAKSGAASGLTHALVDGIEGMFELDFDACGGQKHWMNGFRLVPDPRHGEDAVSLGGDSGAVWINLDTRRAVALHFAGSDGAGPASGCAVAHPLSQIFELLHLSL